jgi:exodeoxyribonuclease V alpha subunit
MMKEIVLTRQQAAAVEMVRQYPMSILTGGPGTGKTTATLQVLKWAESRGLTYLQAAPTGKAAKRMAEATGRPASTIHQTLGCEFDGGGFSFIHNENKPLRCDLLILDEVSMLTSSLLADVMRAVDVRRTKVLFVGDQDQLPSVGAGAVLRDILLSGLIPHTELDVVHRNAGSIVKACMLIKAGQTYTPATALDLEAESPVNLIHVECFTPEETLRGVEAIMCERMPARGFDPITDIQVISPVNEKGILSCKVINDRIRNRLNPGTELTQDDQFRVGDKVINTKNTPVFRTDGGGTYIVNGDIGIITEIGRKEISVQMDGDREVLIPKTDNDLLHAYCITCHRFQGSEAPVILIPVHHQFKFFLSNSWIYTAISRAKQICITIGAFSVIDRAIKNRVPNNRRTMLRDRIVQSENSIAEEVFSAI